MLISTNLHKKSSEVSIKTRSPPFSFKGLETKHTTVKWSIISLIQILLAVKEQHLMQSLIFLSYPEEKQRFNILISLKMQPFNFISN